MSRTLQSRSSEFALWCWVDDDNTESTERGGLRRDAVDDGVSAGQAALTGTVVDSLGARVASANVMLLRDGAKAATTTSGADGTFAFSSLSPGRYQVSASAQGFDSRTTDPVYLGAGDQAHVDVRLEIGPLEQHVVVTAEATQTPQATTGAPVTVIDRATLESPRRSMCESRRVAVSARRS